MGIEGTAMPSFALLDRGEIDALIDYVKYLSVRGEMERALVEEAADLEELEEIDDSKENLVDDKLATIVARWNSAASVEVRSNTTNCCSSCLMVCVCISGCPSLGIRI